MTYKLIASDMDGTLLNSDKVITHKTREEIHRVTKEGVLFVLTTGRPIQGVRPYCTQLKLQGPVITYNGAVILDLKDERILWKKDLLFEDAEHIWKLGLRYDLTLCVWSGNQLYTNKLNERIRKYKKLSNVEPQLLSDFETLKEQGVTKIIWNDEPERISELMNTLSPDQFKEVTYCLSNPSLLEFFNKEASKGNALAKIGELYGISAEEMIAIGDADNDLSMIEYAGLGVAMANAWEQVKEAAQYVTLSNDEDGVKEVLEHYC